MRPKIKRSEILRESKACAYCGDMQTNDDAACCAETPGHFIDVYETRTENFPVGEVDVIEDATADPLRTVRVQRRAAYGVMRAYPVNATARFLCQLTGRKVLRECDLAIAENLGYVVIWEPGPGGDAPF